MVEFEISVCGHHKKIQALIDTGAQANLICGNIFPDEVWKRAQHPMALMAANGDVFSGGLAWLAFLMEKFRVTRFWEM